jgi:hypothetical protein
MKSGGALAAILFVVACSQPVPFTATIDAAASSTETVGSNVQLVVKVTNTGPLIPHLGLVFRTTDLWYQTHRMTDLGGCTIATDSSAFDCGDMKPNETKTFSFAGVAAKAGTFHYELAMRELVQPYDYVDDHPDGPDVQSWDETVVPS